MSRRGITVLLVVALIAFLSGVTFAAGQHEQSAVTLSMQSFWTTDTRAAFVPGIIATYEAQHPGVKIEYTGTTTSMDDLQRLVAVGDPPDIFGTTRSYYTEVAARGLLYDLTDTYAQNHWLDRFTPMVKGWNEVNGRLYGVSALIVPTVWHYNKTMFDKYGLKPPTTLAELLDMSAKLQANGVKWVMLTGQLINIFGAISCQTAGIQPVVDRDWTNPGLMKAAQIFQQLVDTGTINPAITGMDLPSTYPIWGSGEAAMYPMHTGVTLGLEQATGDKFKMDVFYPGVKYVSNPITMYSVSGGMIWAMPAKGPHQQQALEFFKYLVSPEVMGIVAKQGSITPDVQANAKNLTDPILLEANKYLADATGDSMMFVDYLPTKIRDQMQGLLIQVVNGEIKAEDMMKKLGK